MHITLYERLIVALPLEYKKLLYKAEQVDVSSFGIANA